MRVLRRMSKMNTWQRLGAIGVVLALVAAGVVWLRSDDEPSTTPFPEIGYVEQGTEAPHTVVHRTVRPNFDDATISFTDEETATWEGSLAFDDAEVGDFDGEGGFRRRIATTSQPIGTEVSSPEWLVWHVDADADDVIDLSVFRRPLAEDGALLPATQPIGFLHRPYEEYIVSRSGNGQAMASLYDDGGLHPAICRSGLFPDPGPLDPEDAAALLETEDRTVWCTRPRQAPEPLSEEASTLEEGEASEAGDGGPQGFRGTHDLAGARTSISSPAQDDEGSDGSLPDWLPDWWPHDWWPEGQPETACDELLLENQKSADRAEANADEASEAINGIDDPDADVKELLEDLESFQKFIDEVKEARDGVLSVEKFVADLNAAKKNGTLDAFIKKELGDLAQGQIDELKDLLKGKAIDLLLDTINNDATPDQIRELQKVMIEGVGKPPHLFVLDIMKWVRDTAIDAAERIDELGSELEDSDECDERREQQVCRDSFYNFNCGEERPPPELPINDPNRESGGGKGEPHMTTVDGLSYDFQAVGEYTLLRGEDLEVQARFSNIRSGAVSVTVAAAVRLPGADESVSVYASDLGTDDWRIVLGDDAFTVSPGESRLGDYLLILDGNRLRIQVDDQSGVEVFFWDADRPFFNIIHFDADASVGQSVTGGILGDFDGDPSNDYQLADGEVIPVDEMDFETLYQTFGESWRVKTVEESLFTYEPGTDPSTFFNPRFPESEVTLASLSQAELVRGLRPCIEGGIWIEPALNDCTFDVAVMDDEMWVETGRQVQSVLPETAGPVAMPDGLVDTHGGYVLWRHQDFEVRALIAGDGSEQSARLIIRALEVEVNGSTTLIYPGWQDPPASIDLPGDRELQLALWSERELVVTLDGSLDEVTGLATEEGTEPGATGDPGGAGPAAERHITAEAAQEWAVPFPAEDG